MHKDELVNLAKKEEQSITSLFCSDQSHSRSFSPPTHGWCVLTEGAWAVSLFWLTARPWELKMKHSRARWLFTNVSRHWSSLSDKRHAPRPYIFPAAACVFWGKNESYSSQVRASRQCAAGGREMTSRGALFVWAHACARCKFHVGWSGQNKPRKYQNVSE